jgi:NodT family efflux transporter outer membrane factor (OMF) lipoprotein
MSWWSSAAAAAAALALGACTTVGPDFAQPAAPTAQGYAMAGDRAAPGVRMTSEIRQGGAWWRAFGSPQLDGVIREALAGSPTLAEADAVLAKAQAEAAAARGGNLPQVDYLAGIERSRINTSAFGFPGFLSPTVNLYSIGATVSYDLDLFGGRRRAVEGGQARAEAEARRADAAYLSLTGQVALQAVRIASLRAEIATLKDIVADDQRRLDSVRSARQVGGATTAAIVGSEAQIAEDLALLPPVERQLDEARHRLALLAGRSPAEWTAPDFDLAGFTPPAEVPVSLPSALVRGRPDILAAEADLHAAVADVGVATAKLYPDITLSAGLTQTALKPENIFNYASSGWNIGSDIAGPLFDGGTRRAQRDAASAEAKAALARYQRTVLGAFVQVSDLLAALGNDREAIIAHDRSVAAATKRLREATTSFELGAGNLISVLDAQRQLGRVRREAVVAYGQRYADLVELYVATAANPRSPPPAT